MPAGKKWYKGTEPNFNSLTVKMNVSVWKYNGTSYARAGSVSNQFLIDFGGLISAINASNYGWDSYPPLYNVLSLNTMWQNAPIYQTQQATWDHVNLPSGDIEIFVIDEANDGPLISSAGVSYTTAASNIQGSVIYIHKDTTDGISNGASVPTTSTVAHEMLHALGIGHNEVASPSMGEAGIGLPTHYDAQFLAQKYFGGA